MQKFLSLTLALFIGLSFSFDAEARRFGGGKSFGKAPMHRSAPQRQQQQPKQQQQAGKTNAAAGSKMGWLGPLAGLAAGGLLASMFFGDGFEGLQIFDMLIFGLLAFLIFRFIAARKQPQLQSAGAGAMPRQMHDNIFAGNQTTAQLEPAQVLTTPAWFNQERFLNQAQEHFMQLQQLWDANDFAQIADYLTPEMLSYLQQERASLGDGYQATYIDNLQVQLEGIDEQAEQTVATLTFHGTAKTSRFDQGEQFSESWRMERANGDNQPWLIAGIRQNS